MLFPSCHASSIEYWLVWRLYLWGIPSGSEVQVLRFVWSSLRFFLSPTRRWQEMPLEFLGLCVLSLAMLIFCAIARRKWLFVWSLSIPDWSANLATESCFRWHFIPIIASDQETSWILEFIRGWFDVCAFGEPFRGSEMQVLPSVWSSFRFILFPNRRS